MKNFIYILICIISFNTNFYSQKLNQQKLLETEKYLQDGKYKYCTEKCDVIVEIKDNFYTELYPNNEFIKAKIKWTTKEEYKLVITEIQKNDLPFEIGTIMNTKIVRNKGNTFYYESNLEGLSWTGKFEKITN